MKLAIAVLCLLLAGCGLQTNAQQVPEVSTPEVLTGEEPNRGRSLKIKLTLSSPDDLKVREGDTVTEGQVLADRTRDRQRLEAQRRQLQLQINELKRPILGPPGFRPVPEVAALPTPSFLEAVAEVERVRLKVDAAQRSVTQQQRTLDVLQTLPRNELPEAVIPHEQEKLAERQRELDQANADLNYAQAQLSKAQKDREYQEYLHSLELSKRAIALQDQDLKRREQLQRQQEQERTRDYQLTQLLAQLQTLDTQLLNLSAVRSAYRAKVQRIKFEGQNDQNLIVELVLAISPDQSSPGGSFIAPSSNGAGAGGNGSQQRQPGGTTD